MLEKKDRLFIPPSSLAFMSCFYRSDLISESVIHNLCEGLLGPVITFYHPYFPMKKYYQSEMGPKGEYHRFFAVGIKEKIPREKLVELKIKTEEVETSFRNQDLMRTLNLDPGIINLENLILATCKSFAHRIYLGKGVYGELTYLFKDKTYVPLEWTYPDYALSDVILFFNQMRSYLHLIK